MIKIKSLILALTLSPVLLNAWQLPNQAQLSPNSPSKGTAGSVSGNNSGAASFTIFSVPVTLKNGGTPKKPKNGDTPKNGNITVTNSGGIAKITVPPSLQNALNTSAQNAVVTLQTGGLTQQQVAALVVTVAPLIVNSTQAPVPGRLLLSTGSGGQRQSFPTLAAAISYLRTAITTLPINGSFSVKIGGNTTIIRSIQARTPNSSSVETVKKVVTLNKENGETLNFEIVGPRDRANNAAIIVASVLAAGVDPSAAKASITLGLTGADPVSTTNLILSLNGLVANQTVVNLTKLNQAINAYNTILDKADRNSLKALNNTAEFTNIGVLLRNIRAPLG